MRFSLGVSKLHMVLVGSYFILFASYLIIVWRGWKKISPVSVANILPNGADAVVVAMFGPAASPASPASTASSASLLSASTASPSSLLSASSASPASPASSASTVQSAFLAPNVAQGAVAPGAGAAISAGAK